MNKLWYVFILLSNLSLGCESHPTNNTSQTKDSLKISNSVWQSVLTPNANQYMILLDPHGEAEIVLNKYASLAKRNRTSLFATNSIYNGMPSERVNQIIDSLVVSLHQLNSATKIILAGFSGGAKYAQYYASSHSHIDRLILCGAISEQKTSDIPCLLFCGERDMNYASMCLQQSENYYTIVWPGKHAWPDTNTFNLAFNNVVNWEIAKNKSPKTATPLLEKELQLQKSYMENFGNFTDSDWERVVQHLSTNDSDLIAIRCKGVLSMISYLYTDHFIKNGQLEQANKFCQRYLEIDPTNADAYYFKALIEAKLGHQTASKIAYQEALRLGWHETSDRKKASELTF